MRSAERVWYIRRHSERLRCYHKVSSPLSQFVSINVAALLLTVGNKAIPILV